MRLVDVVSMNLYLFVPTDAGNGGYRVWLSTTVSHNARAEGGSRHGALLIVISLIFALFDIYIYAWES